MRRGRSRGPCRGTAFWSRYGVSIRFRLLPRFSKLHISRLRVLDGLCLLASRERDWTFSPSLGYSLHSESRPIGTFQTVSRETVWKFGIALSSGCHLWVKGCEEALFGRLQRSDEDDGDPLQLFSKQFLYALR